MPLPGAGIVRMSDAVAEFGAGFARLGALYFVGPGVPASGKIAFADLRGAAASVPVTTTVTATVSTAAGAVSGSVDFAAQASDTYGAPLSFALASNASVFTAPPTLAGAVASYTVGANRWLRANVALSAAVTNRFARSARANVVWTVTGAPPTATDPPAMEAYRADGGALAVNLAASVSDSSGSALTYAVTGNPRGTASVAGSVLTVAASVGASYGYMVTVSVTNEYGQSVTLNQTVAASAAFAGNWNTPGGTVTMTQFAYPYQGVTSYYSIGTNPAQGNESFGINGGLWLFNGTYYRYRYVGDTSGTFYANQSKNGFNQLVLSWNNATSWVSVSVYPN